MRRILTLATLAALAAPEARLAAQDVRVLPRVRAGTLAQLDADRPMIGITTAGTSERADTLGLRIESVTDDSPAAKAGLKAGDRLQAVNGVSLRADRADAGEEDYAGVLTRRLQREVQRTKAGESVELRVLSGGSARTVRVTPVKASDLLAGTMREFTFARAGGDRAVLGLTIASTGSPRDTLGVFVQAVTADGPAEKAGIVEGDRIAAINGVSLRVAREDAEDRAVGAAKSERLSREIAKLKAGDTAELTVVSAGRSRTVRVTAVKVSELPGGEFTFRFDGTAPGVRMFRVPEGAGGQFEFRALPEMEGRLRELMPRMEELRRRMQTEGAARRRVGVQGE